MPPASPENEELARARVALTTAGCDVAILSSVAHVTYVSGWAMPHAVGFSAVTPYAAPFAVVPVAGGDTWLATSVFHTAPAGRESRLSHLLTYDGFGHFAPTDPRGSYLKALRHALRQAG